MRHWVNTERTLQTHRYKSLQTCNTTSVCRWELTPCSLVDADASVESVASVFRVVLLPNRKAADFSETLVPSYTASDSRTLIYRSSRWGSQISHTDVLWLVKTQFGKRKIKTRLWISAHLEVFHPTLLHLPGKQMAVCPLLWLFQIPSSCEWGGACDSFLEPLRMTVVELDYCKQTKKQKKSKVTYTLHNLLHYSNLSICLIHTPTTDMNCPSPCKRAGKTNIK